MVEAVFLCGTEMDKGENFGKFGTLLREIPAKAWVRDCKWSPDGAVLAFVAHDATLTTVDITDDYRTETVKTRLLPFNSIAFPTTTTIIAACNDCFLYAFTKSGPVWHPLIYCNPVNELPASTQWLHVFCACHHYFNTLVELRVSTNAMHATAPFFGGPFWTHPGLTLKSWKQAQIMETGSEMTSPQRGHTHDVTPVVPNVPGQPLSAPPPPPPPTHPHRSGRSLSAICSSPQSTAPPEPPPPCPSPKSTHTLPPSLFQAECLEMQRTTDVTLGDPPRALCSISEVGGYEHPPNFTIMTMTEREASLLSPRRGHQGAGAALVSRGQVPHILTDQQYCSPEALGPAMWTIHP